MATTHTTKTDPTKALDALENQVANSSEKNRNFFTATLLAFIYLSIVVVQTSDLDLLIGRGIHLPLIDVTMPIFAFYLIAPLMVLALHFNLLQNIENHHAKLIAWRNEHPNQSMPRESIYPFIFDFATLDKTSTFGELTQIINQIVIYWSGPITALLTLWRFTDYQSWLITFWHFLLLCASLWLVMRTRKSIDGTISAEQSKISLAQVTFSTLSEYLATILKALKNKPVLFFTWSVQGISKQKFSNFLGVSIWAYGLTQFLLLTCLMFTPVIHFIKSHGIESFFPRIVIERRDNLLALDAASLKFQFELSAKILITDEEVISAIKNKTRPTARRATNIYDWFMNFGNGLDLRERSLKLADLSYADLRRAWLENANLQGSDMSYTQLQGARLSGAKLQYSNLEFAKLTSAVLEKAQLQGANLKLARLIGAEFLNAKLNGANLRNANLDSTGLVGTNLEEAKLERAQLKNIRIDENTLFSNCIIDGQTSVEVVDILKTPTALDQEKTNALLAQMRKQGWPK